MDSFHEHFKAFSYVAQEINSSLQISSLSSSKLKQSLQNISQFFAVSNDQVIVRPLFACLPQEISSSLFGSKDNGKRYLLALAALVLALDEGGALYCTFEDEGI